MKKLMDIVMPIKMIAGGILVGLIGFYMVVGTIYAQISGAEFEYSVSFAFIIQSAVLAVVISLLWQIFLGEVVIKKWRFFKRAIVFNLSLLVVIVLCFFASFALPIPGELSYLWLIGACCITVGIAIIAALNEIYYRRTGKHYTEMLQVFQGK